MVYVRRGLRYGGISGKYRSSHHHDARERRLDGGITVDYEAFIADNTEDIFLNYYNALPNSKHDTFVRMTDDFWNKVGVNSFATAVSEFKKQFESYMNQ